MDSCLSRLAVSNKDDDPNQFDLTVASLLVGLDAERYIDIFKKKNIGQTTLTELSNEDLERLGVDDAQIRAKIIKEVKSLPLYEETVRDRDQCNNNIDLLEPVELQQILKDTSHHLHCIQLSFIANRMALRNTKHVQDCLLYRDLYGADIALKTLDSITHILNSMEKVLHANLKVKASKQKKKNRMLVGAAGGSVIAVLAYFFYKSLINL